MYIFSALGCSEEWTRISRATLLDMCRIELEPAASTTCCNDRDSSGWNYCSVACAKRLQSQVPKDTWRFESSLWQASTCSTMLGSPEEVQLVTQ